MTAAYTVVWTEASVADLDAILAYIASSEPAYVSPALERIARRAESLERSPLRGPVVPELSWHGVMGYRQLLEPPWRIIYRVDGTRVAVVAVIDGRRQLGDALLDRLLRD